MHRREFIHRCCFTCLGLAGIGTLLESCDLTKSVSGSLSDTRMTIPLSKFRGRKGDYRSYLIVQHEGLNYPVVVYRESDSVYTALLLRCTHQYSELNVSGNLISCPAHGSEFNTKGEPTQGPAEAGLRRFPTSTDAENLYIDLV